jgi:3'-phosphoadenosine 5'-phosphosulfate sulfotransferase (PAPS reductase)/FAD synthetase
LIKHVISVSGGKDSLATLLIALENCPRESIVPIFCDTGNEHQAVYDYLAYIEQALDITITRLKADFSEQIARKRMFIARDQRKGRKNGQRIRWTNAAKRRALAVLHPSGNPFLDLCMWKGRFPSPKAQFCTENLKRNIAVAFQLDLIDTGHQVLSWQGVRRDESLNRRNAKKIERIGGGIWTFRPIVEWTAMQVFEFCAKRGIQPNPLYKQGMGRVGCMPCINVNKAELKQIALRFPEAIEEKAEWERKVAACSKRMAATFIPAPGITPSQAKDNTIWHVVEWAKTTRGGKQFDLLGDLADSTACSSAYGLCE